jgi:hypothetical protein
VGTAWGLLIIGLLAYSLVQYTTWTRRSFRRGLTIFRLSEPFPKEVHADTLNKIFETRTMMFEFLEADAGLLKTKPVSRHAANSLIGAIQLPKLLGEIQLSNSGVGNVTIRVPLSYLLLRGTIVLILAYYEIQGIYSIWALTGMLLIGGILTFYELSIDKSRLFNGIGEIRTHLAASEATKAR